MTTRIKIRRDTAGNWYNNNPVLALGEPGLETDTRKIKYGDGSTAWNSLLYAGGVNINANSSISVGYGTTENGGQDAIAIGTNAGIDQAWSTVAIGNNAGNSNQAPSAIAIGRSAGQDNQGWDAIAIGRYAGQENQTSGLAIGYYAGRTNQLYHTVAIGAECGRYNQGFLATAIGRSAGYNQQGNGAVAIGHRTGEDSQGNHSVAIGRFSSNYNQGYESISIGTYAGYAYQGDGTVAVGKSAGESVQGQNAVAIGYEAGRGTSSDSYTNNTLSYAFVSGDGAPNMVLDGSSDIRVGMLIFGYAVQSNTYITAVDTNTNTVTLSANLTDAPSGSYQFTGAQGQNAIAIGAYAAQKVQHSNSIVINASGQEVQSAGENTVVIKTVRSVSATDGFYPCYYNPTTGELVYFTA